MSLVDLPPPPRVTAGPAPLRRPGSARRTSSIDVDWPDGRDGDMRFVGRARDIVTPTAGGRPKVCAEDSLEARVGGDRTIHAISCDRPGLDLSGMVGQRGGGHLRQVIAEVAPEERRRGTPLYLLLDDFSGASLIAGWAWTQWSDDWMAQAVEGSRRRLKQMEGVCIGFQTGSSALDPDRRVGALAGATGPSLRNPDDPEGWHEFTPQTQTGFRRARRIDVSIGDVVVIDAAFQDSGSTPEGERALLHEYRISATADRRTLRLLTLQAEPRVVPFPECVLAPGNMDRLIGTPMPELREAVLSELRATAGCTHLNDALRALAEAPVLVEALQAELSAG